MVVVVRLQQHDASVRRHGVKNDGQTGARFVRERLADTEPDGAACFGALDGVGDEDGISGHDAQKGEASAGIGQVTALFGSGTQCNLAWVRGRAAVYGGGLEKDRRRSFRTMCIHGPPR